MKEMDNMGLFGPYDNKWDEAAKAVDMGEELSFTYLNDGRN
jgi:hypothetical protein